MKLLLPTILLFLSICSNTSTAQTLEAYQKAIQTSIENNDPTAALFYTAEALKIAPEDVRLQLKYAELAYDIKAYELAETTFEQLLNTSTKAAKPGYIPYQLADTKKQLGKYKEAISLLKNTAKEIQLDTDIQQKYEQLVADCQWASERKPSDDFEVKITALDDNINTPYSDFGAVEWNDNLVFSSHRFEHKESRRDPSKFYSKILTADDIQWIEQLNVTNQTTAHFTLHPNGNTVYFTLCKYTEKNQLICSIISHTKDNEDNWNKNINWLTEHSETSKTFTQPTVGFDSTHQKVVMYFASKNLDQSDDFDIYCAEISDNKLANIQPVDEINTPKDDITPFFHTPSQTLFFSSNGYQNMGGFDIYKYKLNDSDPTIQHLHVPINSSYDDLYYYLNEEKSSGYLSSNRPPAQHFDAENKSCCYDIFEVKYKYQEREEPLTIVVNDTVPSTEIITPTPPTVSINEIPLPTSATVYFPNDEPDLRSRSTTTKTSYTKVLSSYRKKRFDYMEIAFGTYQDRRMQRFFNQDMEGGFEALQQVANTLKRQLPTCDHVVLSLKGFTSPRAPSDYNLKLSNRRIESILNYFEQEILNWNEYIRAGKLEIQTDPKGEMSAPEGIRDAYDDPFSIYHIDAIMERRASVEILEICED